MIIHAIQYYQNRWWLIYWIIVLYWFALIKSTLTHILYCGIEYLLCKHQFVPPWAVSGWSGPVRCVRPSRLGPVSLRPSSQDLPAGWFPWLVIMGHHGHLHCATSSISSWTICVIVEGIPIRDLHIWHVAPALFVRKHSTKCNYQGILSPMDTYVQTRQNTTKVEVRKLNIVDHVRSLPTCTTWLLLRVQLLKYIGDAMDPKAPGDWERINRCHFCDSHAESCWSGKAASVFATCEVRLSPLLSKLSWMNVSIDVLRNARLSTYLSNGNQIIRQPTSSLTQLRQSRKQ